MFILCCYGHTRVVCFISIPCPAINFIGFDDLVVFTWFSIRFVLYRYQFARSYIYIYLFGASRKTASYLLFWSPNCHHHYIIFFIIALNVQLCLSICNLISIYVLYDIGNKSINQSIYASYINLQQSYNNNKTLRPKGLEAFC